MSEITKVIERISSYLVGRAEFKNECVSCDHLNLSINDERRQYLCKVGLCPALLPDLEVEAINHLVGWVRSEDTNCDGALVAARREERLKANREKYDEEVQEVMELIDPVEVEEVEEVVLKTSVDWCEHFSCVVLDPDGWDRTGGFHHDFKVLQISEEEFVKRCSYSTMYERGTLPLPELPEMHNGE